MKIQERDQLTQLTNQFNKQITSEIYNQTYRQTYKQLKNINHWQLRYQFKRRLGRLNWYF